MKIAFFFSIINIEISDSMQNDAEKGWIFYDFSIIIEEEGVIKVDEKEGKKWGFLGPMLFLLEELFAHRDMDVLLAQPYKYKLTIHNGCYHLK